MQQGKHLCGLSALPRMCCSQFALGQVSLKQVLCALRWMINFSGDPAISDPRSEARAVGKVILRLNDMARFLGASTGAIALVAPGVGPKEWRARARWATGLDGNWETQYAEVYPDYADDDARDAAYEREEQALRPGRLGDTPLLMVPAGMVTEQLRFPTCAEERCVAHALECSRHLR